MKIFYKAYCQLFFTFGLISQRVHSDCESSVTSHSEFSWRCRDVSVLQGCAKTHAGDFYVIIQRRVTSMLVSLRGNNNGFLSVYKLVGLPNVTALGAASDSSIKIICYKHNRKESQINILLLLLICSTFSSQIFKI